MALFTEDQKSAIRNYLGYSELFHDIDTRLEQQMQDIGLRSPSAYTRVVNLLAKLAAVDAQIDTCATDGELTLDTAEDGVKFMGPRKIEALQNYGRSLIQQMSIIFEVAPVRDYYDGDGPMGGTFAVG